MFRFYSKADETNRVSIVGECTDGVLKVAAARCSSKDNFVRKKGRELAEKRLQSNELCFEIPADKCDVRTFIVIAKGLCQQIKNSPQNLKSYLTLKT